MTSINGEIIRKADDYSKEGTLKAKQKKYIEANNDFSKAIELLSNAYHESMKNWNGIVSDEMISVELTLAEYYYNRGKVKIELEDYVGAYKNFELVIACRESFSNFSKVKSFDHYFADAYLEKGLLLILVISKSTNDKRWHDEGCKALKKARELGLVDADELLKKHCKNT